ncbi:MAG: carbohydrate kinase [Pseudomonadota bacterium]
MILVCGEALYDMFGSEVGDGFTFQARAAGSPFNVAVGLCRLGVEADLFTGVSTDFLGDKLMRRLGDEGVGLSRVKRLDAPTTTAYVSLREDNSATYAFYGLGAADRSITSSAEIDLSEVDALHFGSYSFVVGDTAEAYLELMRRAAGKRFISYDPNVRPTVEADMEVWRARLVQAAPLCNLLKMSDEDAELLFPGAGLDDVAEQVLANGAEIVAITRGADGAQVHTKDHRLQVAAPPTEVVDTVGAGDSFQAAFLSRLYKDRLLAGRLAERTSEQFLQGALEFALTAAAKTCSRQGADLPYAPELV